MRNALERLVSVAGSPLGTAIAGALPDLRAFGLARDLGLGELLARRNGFFAFEAALRVFPTAPAETSRDLVNWNSDDLWRGNFGVLASGCLFFAEDVFGNQFALTTAGICSFDAETGERAVLGDTIHAWAEAVLADFEFLTGHPIAREWQATHGALRANERLLPITAFALGGEYELDNLRAVDGAKAMRIRGPVAQRLHDAPDGAAVRLGVKE